MMRILRLAGDSGLLTAEVFEELFVRQLGSCFSVHPVSLRTWADTVLGSAEAPLSLGSTTKQFRTHTAGMDFLCPSYEAISLTPLLLALRNRASARVRLLLIAHAPGAYLMEWVLLAPLLAPGDRIIAPSENARAVIEMLNPEIARFVRVIPHPMEPLPHARRRKQNRIVSLGRIHPTKLVHRQIEAMHLLCGTGSRVPRLEIAGALCDAGSSEDHPYARSLKEKIRRLRLTEHVHLVGPIRGADRKADFLARSRMLLNLSVTVEESFGKSPVEALGVGVPVLATRWNGLPETVGGGGAFAPVIIPRPGVADVSAEVIAETIERLLVAPPTPETCRAEAARFRPEVVLPAYQQVLEEARTEWSLEVGPPEWPGEDVNAAPVGGMLSCLAPLTAFGWRELFDHYAQSCGAIRSAWEGKPVAELTEADRVRSLLLVATKAPLERFLSGASVVLPSAGRIPARSRPSNYVERLAAAAALPGLPTGRIASLMEVRNAGRMELLRDGIERLSRDGVGGAGVEYLRVELQAGEGDVAGASRVCLDAITSGGDGEFEAHRFRQLAQLARRARRPHDALPALAEWLDRFPDSPESGPVWLDLTVNALQAGPAYREEADLALSRARALLGEHPVIRKLGRLRTLAVASTLLT